MSCGGVGALRGCVNALLITAAAAAAVVVVVAAVRPHARGGVSRVVWVDARPSALSRCRAAPDAACEAVWRAARTAFLGRPRTAR
jgi:hypothetical protein